MDIAKQIIDQRVNKILEENPELFSDSDAERKKSKAFLLLGVAAYLDIDIAEAVQYITDGGSDGGFDAAYIEDAQDSQLNVVLFQSKYSRKLDSDSNFPSNAVEKAVNTVKCVFDPSAKIQLNDKSREKVDEIRSFILDGHIPYVTFVMLNNGLSWNQDGQNHIANAFGGQDQVSFVHFSHHDILNYINRSKPIDTQLNFAGKAIQEDFNYKRVMLGRVSVNAVYQLMDEYGDRLLEKNIRRYLGKNVINEQIRAQRPFSQYFLAYMLGKRLLNECGISLDQLTHINFEKVKDYFEAKKESLYAEEEHRLVDILKNYFNQRDLEEIDGRTMAAVFRRFDVLVRYLS